MTPIQIFIELFLVGNNFSQVFVDVKKIWVGRIYLRIDDSEIENLLMPLRHRALGRVFRN